ncbi:methyltransferase [Arthrobacter phage Shrooms]|nr:methyltransferase [Arthrobacter phage Shrooms]
MSKRFDSEEYLRAWQDHGTYPAIHDAIFTAIEDHTGPDEKVVDLGASTGLLTRRMLAAGRRVVPVEPHTPSRSWGAVYGTWEGLEVHAQPVSARAGIEPFRALLEDERPTVLIARRVLPEVYEATELARPGTWQNFLDALHESTIELIILEGRKFSSRTTHPLGHRDREVQALGPNWRTIWTGGDVAVLEKV